MSTDASRAGARPVRTRPGVAHVLARFSVAQLRLFAILIGGAAGALTRAGLAEGLVHRPGQWPWATFIANLAGAFVLGWLVTRLVERVAPTRNWRPLLGTGFAGALTTFSTFQVETFEFARAGHLALAVAYPVTSIVAGMALAIVGSMVARWGRHW